MELKLTKNEIENTYVIGDVHGCFFTLLNLIKRLPFNAELIFVGDLCDRGLYTKEVIEFIIQNDYKVILGNHDNYMIKHSLESLNGVDNRWLRENYMGGKQTIESYSNEKNILLTHIEWLKTLPHYILIDQYFITHGFGLPYFKRRELESSKVGFLKNRIEDEEEWGCKWEKGWEEYNIINIFGHTNYEEVKEGINYFGIDTGCVYGKKLTSIKLGTMEIFDEVYDIRDIDIKRRIKHSS